MIAQILQNLARPDHLAHCHPAETALLPHGDDESLFSTVIRGIKGRLAEARKRQSCEAVIRKAIAHLHDLSDEQLRDMGISRMDIAHVVRYGKD